MITEYKKLSLNYSYGRFIINLFNVGDGQFPVSFDRNPIFVGFLRRSLTDRDDCINHYNNHWSKTKTVKLFVLLAPAGTSSFYFQKRSWLNEYYNSHSVQNNGYIVLFVLFFISVRRTRNKIPVCNKRLMLVTNSILKKSKRLLKYPYIELFDKGK